MASLYIKDEEANRLAERLAAERGLTKTAAVKLALNHELERLPPTGRRPAIEVLEEFWSAHPLGQPTGREADKAFYDSLSDEDDL